MSIILNHNEIQESPFSDILHSSLSEVFHNEFFTRLETTRISIDSYRLFVMEKYSSVGYFVKLLENAEHLSEPISHDLAEVFRSNRLDELGYFAGKITEEYRHETWRIRSLAMFGVSKEDLTNAQPLGFAKKHSDIAAGLAQSTDVFEVVGALLFTELFVVYEMKSMIKAFERDLPVLFPENEYSYDRFPFNPQEYWYGHAIHDTWHYRAIEEAVIANLGEGEIKKKNLESLLRGIRKITEAKKALFSKEMFEMMKAK